MILKSFIAGVVLVAVVAVLISWKFSIPLANVVMAMTAVGMVVMISANIALDNCKEKL